MPGSPLRKARKHWMSIRLCNRELGGSVKQLYSNMVGGMGLLPCVPSPKESSSWSIKSHSPDDSGIDLGFHPF